MPKLEVLERKVMNLSLPHYSFSYPSFAFLPEGQVSEISDLKIAVQPPHPEGVVIARDLARSLEKLFDELQITKSDVIAVQIPSPREFMEIASRRATVRKISRDPQDLAETDFSAFRLVFLSHPSGADGFYYPKDIYDRILQRALFNPRTVVYSDERNMLFSFNSVVPGTAASFLPTGRVYIGGGVYPVMCPQGPFTAWYFSHNKPAANDDLIEATEIQLACQAVLSFRSRQGRALQEFQRKLLVLQMSMRVMADLLKPAVLAKRAHVPFWPETGFYLLVDISTHLLLSGQTMPELLAKMENNHGLLIKSGEEFGLKDSLWLCFAAPPHRLKELFGPLLGEISGQNKVEEKDFRL